MESCDVEHNGELRFARQVMPDCAIVFDVGTRTDDYLVRLNPESAFHLFEPMERHFQILKGKTSQRQNVVVNHCALGSANESCLIYPESESIAHRENSGTRALPIRVVRLDDYCRAHAIDRIDFLKIDTEGHELEVLRGGRDIVQSATSIVQFEYGGTYRDADITLEMVFAELGPGWYFYRIEPGWLTSVAGFHRRLEDFRYANYAASRRPLPAGGRLGDWGRRLTSPLRRLKRA